jgi:hypothetical protein
MCADERSNDKVMIPKLEEKKESQSRLPHQPHQLRGLTIFLHIFFPLQVTLETKFFCQL